MEDSLSIIFAFIIAIILMFFVPLLDTWELQDNLSYVLTYAAVTDFVDTVRNTGYISQSAYDAFLLELGATGNTYDVTMEHREFNEDIDAYLNTYTNEIVKTIDNDKIYKLDKYDYFYVTVKNTNLTQATVLTNFFASDADTNFKIGVAYGGVVWSVRDEF